MLHLNVFPAAVNESSPSVRICSRNDDRDSSLRGRRADRFQTYAFRDQTFAWPLVGCSLPDDLLIGDWELRPMASLPARVVAFGVRDALLIRLRGLGFERLPGRLDSPLRLYRRKLNLAEEAFGTTLADGVGTFPVYALQEIVLTGDETQPGSVGLIVDIRLVNRLDVDLERLTAARLDLLGEKVKWQHKPECACGDEPPRGLAGFVQGSVNGGRVQVRLGRTTRDFPAACLAPTAHRRLIEEYVARLGQVNEAQAHSRLDRVLIDFRSIGKQWQHVTEFASKLGTIDVFGGAVASLGSAMAVESKSSGSEGYPARLASATEPKLNFRYGTPLLSEAAGQGLRKHGPYDVATQRMDRIESIMLAPEPYGREADRLASALAGGINLFPGMNKQYRLVSFNVRHQRFKGTLAADYRAAAVAAAAANPGLVWLLVPAEERQSDGTADPYRAAKAIFVARGIPVQAVQRDKLSMPDESLQWIVSALALQAYAKVGNVPFVLHDPTGRAELVIGVGRADVEVPASDKRQQLFGAAVVFRQDGDFLYAGSTASVADRDSYEDLLTQLIGDAVRRYENALAKPVDRVVVHIFKRTGQREIRAAQKAMGDRAGQVALLHVESRQSLVDGRCATGWNDSEAP
jgi:hypothetical protein